MKLMEQRQCVLVQDRQIGQWNRIEIPENTHR